MKRSFFYRLLEILPGSLTWLTFILPIILSFYAPMVISIAILTFAIFWFIKTIIMSYHLVLGYRRYRREIKIDWLSRCQKELPSEKWKNIYNLIIIATYKEELPTLRATFQTLALSNFPKERIIVVLATEERDEINALKNTKALQKEFGNTFNKFFYTVHPANIPGEVVGKGPNITYSIKKIKSDFIDKSNIPYEDIIVTTLDADHRVDKQYLACLTYHYLTTPDPIHKSFQPIPLFFNNIWQAAFPMRLIAMGSSFWQMIEATRPYRLRNFASHGQSFKGLVETDFWSTQTIVEDGHQYWRSYFKFNGNYSVVPIFTPIYQDAVHAGEFKTTIKDQYLQKRRWAWGASDIPYSINEALKNKSIPFTDKWLQILRLIEGHYSWATTSIIIAAVGWLPIVLNNTYRSTVLAYNFPYFYSRILTAAMLGMITTLTISTILLPPPPGKKYKGRGRIALEWILTPIIMPVTNIIFGAIPAIDSQTRLMLGIYLDVFHVTTKAVTPTNINK